MSWYVKQLLTDSSVIRSNLYSLSGRELPDGEVEIILESILDSTAYDDLLELEIKILELDKQALLSHQEKQIIKLLKNAHTIASIGRELGYSKWIDASDKVTILCNKLAFLLGSKFTDDGFIDYMVKKYHLTDEEKITLTTYINGKFQIHRGKKIG